MRIELQPQGRVGWPRLDIPLRIEPVRADGLPGNRLLRRSSP
ncbi:MAG: hypothetical protein WBA65_02550 [Rhodanobacter sp.]